MFLENPVNRKSQFGSIEVICGSMFSGKTEELIRRIKRAELASKKVKVFKPSSDKRAKKNIVISHDSNKVKAVVTAFVLIDIYTEEILQ